MAIARATATDVADFLGMHPEWALVDGKLQREFRFANFVSAFGFMSQVALIAERTDHHPEWFNVYSRVRVDLTTHDAQGVSARDFRLAEAMDEIATRMTAR